MSTAPDAMAHALINDAEMKDLEALAGRLDASQLIWASGFLAGRASALGGAMLPVAETADAPEAAPSWTIVYGSQTGNGRRVAEGLHGKLLNAGLAATLIDSRDFPLAKLKKTERLLLVISTHGNGEPPDSSMTFYEALMGERAPKLPQLQYAVLALGDSSYEHFCETGRQVDRRLAELGANRLEDCANCDVDYEDPASAWVARRLEHAEKLAAETGGQRAAAPRLTVVERKPRFDRDTPFSAEVYVNQRITGRGSSKDVRHLELSLEDSGLTYQPGDALGVFAHNPAEAVQAVLDITGLDADAPVTLDDASLSLGEALTGRREITRLTRSLLAGLAGHEAEGRLARLLESAKPAEIQRYIRERQLGDVLGEYAIRPDAQTLVTLLPRITPRLYSIASSLEAHPDEVHVTVSVVNDARFGRSQPGCASNFLARNPETVPVYVERNNDFRLPEDGDRAIIMVGAGTGIAPYRAFVEHRRAAGSRGRNWLLFGDRTFRDDFLYQTEWQQHLKAGALHRIDLAFSRDGAHKVYVQDRLREQGADIYRWLQDGANLYLCGDADGMAPGVEQALTEVFQAHGNTSAEDAAEQIRMLRREGRFLKDVY